MKLLFGEWASNDFAKTSSYTWKSRDGALKILQVAFHTSRTRVLILLLSQDYFDTHLPRLKAEINTLRDVTSVSSLINNGLHKW